MKLFFAALTVFAVMGFTPVKKQSALPPASAGVYLFAVSTGPSYAITATAGTGINSDEVPVTASAEGALIELSVGGGGGGTNTGPPQVAPLVISKGFDKSSQRFRRSLLQGNRMTVELRYYDGMAVNPVYVIRMTDAYLTSMVASADQSCTGNCPSSAETLTFTSAGLITWTNNKTSPAQIVTYNTITNVSTISGL